jgi:hypothetical protein
MSTTRTSTRMILKNDKESLNSNNTNNKTSISSCGLGENGEIKKKKKTELNATNNNNCSPLGEKRVKADGLTPSSNGVDNQANDSSTTASTSANNWLSTDQPFTLKVEINAIAWMLFILAFIMRFARIDEPKSIV